MVGLRLSYYFSAIQAGVAGDYSHMERLINDVLLKKEPGIDRQAVFLDHQCHAGACTCLMSMQAIKPKGELPLP